MKGEGQVIVTELRSLGDNRTVVVHTNDSRVYRKLQASSKPIKIVPYEQEQGGKVAVLGVDLYFPKEHRKWLEENMESVPQRGNRDSQIMNKCAIDAKDTRAE